VCPLRPAEVLELDLSVAIVANTVLILLVSLQLRPLAATTTPVLSDRHVAFEFSEGTIVANTVLILLVSLQLRPLAATTTPVLSDRHVAFGVFGRDRVFMTTHIMVDARRRYLEEFRRQASSGPRFHIEPRSGRRLALWR